MNSIIEEMSDKHWLFSSNPGHDFMRQSLGKLSFADTMRLRHHAPGPYHGKKYYWHRTYPFL